MTAADEAQARQDARTARVFRYIGDEVRRRMAARQEAQRQVQQDARPVAEEAR